MKRYLFDTNVISELRKPKPHGGVVAWMRNLQYEQVFLSAITIGELQAGVELTRKQDPPKAKEIEDWIDVMVQQVQVLTMDVLCFREWARLMTGKPHQIVADAMMAATARVHGLTVATRNESDFKYFDVPLFNPFTYPK